MRNAAKPEVLVGRVFGILGAKNDELKREGDEPDYKARFVCQGSNVRTRLVLMRINCMRRLPTHRRPLQQHVVL
jgi:hypothetical protein